MAAWSVDATIYKRSRLCGRGVIWAVLRAAYFDWYPLASKWARNWLSSDVFVGRSTVRIYSISIHFGFVGDCIMRIISDRGDSRGEIIEALWGIYMARISVGGRVWGIVAVKGIEG